MIRYSYRLQSESFSYSLYSKFKAGLAWPFVCRGSPALASLVTLVLHGCQCRTVSVDTVCGIVGIREHLPLRSRCGRWRDRMNRQTRPGRFPGVSMLATISDTAAALIALAVIPAREFTVVARGESITFVSSFMDDTAWDLLKFVPGSFARSLYNADKLSDKQLAWVHKLAVDFAAQSAAVDSSEPSKFDALFDAFEAAKNKGAKRLTLRFEGINVKPNRDLTALWVTSQTETEEGNYGLQPKFLGKITRMSLDSRLSDDVKATIMGAASDPLTAAIRYGKVSGSCSCCGRELTDPRSIEAGIGPICATKFGW